MRFFTFDLEGYEDFGGWEYMPKKELMSFAVNPYNGRVCMRISERENAAEVIERVINQLSRDLRLLKIEDADSDINTFADVCDGLREVKEPRVVKAAKRPQGKRKAS